MVKLNKNLDRRIKMDKSNTGAEISLINILNIFKKNLITLAYFLLASLLISVIYANFQIQTYSSTARIISKVAFTATTEPQVSSTLKGEAFLTEMVAYLSDNNIIELEGKPITKEVLSTKINGKLVTAGGVLYDITMTSEDKDTLVPILTAIRSELINHLKNHASLSPLGHNLEFNSSPSSPISLTISQSKIYLIGGVIGIIFASGIILVTEIFKGYIYDKYDLITENLIEFKLEKKYRKLAKNNFISWPLAIPVNIEKALAEGNNNVELTKVQDMVISKVGFDNNVQIFYSTTTKKIHALFLKTYINNFIHNKKNVALINLDNEQSFSDNPNDLTTTISEAQGKKDVLSGGPNKYMILDILKETYPSSVINNSVFLNYIAEIKQHYDFVIINAGKKFEEFSMPLSKLGTPILTVYSNFTNKREYHKNLNELNDAKTITLLIG